MLLKQKERLLATTIIVEAPPKIILNMNHDNNRRMDPRLTPSRP